MGVSATHLHQAIVPAGIGEATDFLGGSSDYFRIAKFIHKSHGSSGLCPQCTPGLWPKTEWKYTLRKSRGYDGFLSSKPSKPISSHLLHGLFVFSEYPKSLHLVESVLLADLAHRKADMNEDPVARNRQVVLQEPKVHFAPHTGHLYGCQVRSAGKEFDNLPGNS